VSRATVPTCCARWEAAAGEGGGAEVAESSGRSARAPAAPCFAISEISKPDKHERHSIIYGIKVGSFFQRLDTGDWLTGRADPTRKKSRISNLQSFFFNRSSEGSGLACLICGKIDQFNKNRSNVVSSIVVTSHTTQYRSFRRRGGG